MMKNRFNVAILSCTPDDWGGSEDLWARSIPILRNHQCDITLYKNNINFSHPEIVTLANQGVRLVPLTFDHSFSKKVVKKVKSKIVPQKAGNPLQTTILPEKLRYHLQQDKPDLVLIIQGINFDGLEYAFECHRLGISYVLFANKGVDFYWPPPSCRSEMRSLYQSAKKCFFSSIHNLTLTEEQFGIRFTNAQILWNTIKLDRKPLPYPKDNSTIRLACVARLFIIDKGQDILFRVLNREEWRKRNIEVSLIGKGADETALKDMAALLQLNNIKFPGQQSDITSVWKTHHALILPSRSEGMALSLIESMAAGRPAIVTKAGGHAEIIKHGINGFICDAAETPLAECMEQAWQQIDKWEEIGKNANEFVNKNIPEHPEQEFAFSIIKLLNED